MADFLAGKEEVRPFVFAEQDPSSFYLETVPAKLIGSLHFYHGQLGHDVHIFREFHSITMCMLYLMLFSVAGIKSCMPKSCGALLMLLNVGLARNISDLWGGLCINRS